MELKGDSTVEFTNFKDAQPKAGMVTWKGNREGIPLLFNAEMRWRGAGGGTVLSPAFDYWDGYRVHVRHEVEWADELVDLDAREREIRPLVDIAPCPFCKETPKVHFSSPTGWPPMKADYFYMTCCNFTAGFSRRAPDLRPLINDWNAALGADKVPEELADSHESAEQT